MRSQLKSYFSISKKEWNGMVILVILIVLTLVSPYVYQLFYKDSTINVKEFNAAVALLNKGTGGANNNDDERFDNKNLKPSMFRFDPNNMTLAKWKQIGLNDRQAGIIQHYQDKGGHFYKKEDLKKIYSITPADYKRLAPYVDLPDGDGFAKKAGPGVVIELNGADSALLTELKGIGPSFAKRIINYRQRLGGFYKKEQLKEVFGLDEDKYAAMKNQVSVNAKALKKINVNKVAFEELSHFPYLSFKQMGAIIAYRDQHGDYENITDLRNIAILDDVTLHKIQPYLNFK